MSGAVAPEPATSAPSTAVAAATPSELSTFVSIGEAIESVAGPLIAAAVPNAAPTIAAVEALEPIADAATGVTAEQHAELHAQVQTMGATVTDIMTMLSTWLPLIKKLM